MTVQSVAALIVEYGLARSELHEWHVFVGSRVKHKVGAVLPEKRLHLGFQQDVPRPYLMPGETDSLHAFVKVVKRGLVMINQNEHLSFV